MNFRVLVSAPYMQPVLDEYRQVFDENGIELVVPPVKERLSEAELLKWVADIDGIICGDDQITERVLDAAPKLKVISKWGTGIDSIDVEASRRRGIPVCNTANAFSDAVADSIMGYILCFARQLPWMDRDIRSGRWDKRPARSLKECVLGVIGVGNVGRTAIRRACSFGMAVLGNDIVEIPQDFVDETGLEVVSKEDLLCLSDFVSLNCDLNPTSFHLIGDQELVSMKETAYLINTSRGPVVDEGALIRALDDGQIAGAALDVFEVEPLPADSRLRGFDNVLLAPHNANSSPTAWKQVHENTISNLVKELHGVG